MKKCFAFANGIHWGAWVLAGWGLAASPMEVQARTYVVPHILEKSGRISDTPYTFDTTLFVTYNQSLGGGDKGSATVELYLYDNETGAPLRGATDEVCAPCTYQLDAAHRKLSISVEELILERGGGFDQPLKTSFAVLLMSGPNAEAVNVRAQGVNSHAGPSEVSMFDLGAAEVPSRAEPGTPDARRTFVLPHVLESSGSASTSQYVFDTTLYATYVPGLPGVREGAGAEVQVYLYDPDGKPMVGGSGLEVCNPCTYALGAAARQQVIALEPLIDKAGGFGGQRAKPGFAVVSVGGEDAVGVNLFGFIVNAHTNPFDLSVFGFEPEPIRAPGDAKRTFVLPHILEKSGATAVEPYTLDTTLVAAYVPGLGGTAAGQGAEVELFLFDPAGKPLAGKAGSAVCNPCTFALGPGNDGTVGARKLSIRMDDLILAAGGFDESVKTGFGLVHVGGLDPAGVALQGFIVNSHTSAFDLSVFGFTPEEVRSVSLAANPAGDNLSAVRTHVVPHVFEQKGRISTTPYTFDTTLFATYAGGLPGVPAGTGASLKLYLYDELSGKPLRGQAGEVCFPCAFDLTPGSPKLSVSLDNLMEAAGGFSESAVVSASALVVLGGDEANVNLQGFVVNAHTSPFDLAVFGFEPEPLRAAQLRPMPVVLGAGPTGLELTLPSVIDASYSIERKLSPLDPWISTQEVQGDGTVLRIPLPTSDAPTALYRVVGH